ncbi:MAG: hypothetical protein J6K61_04165 [Clostridia bacterium]|nr:hypothetical protein [Clostridia bacterium]
MTVSMQAEALLFLLSLLFGALMGALYSLLRISRMLLGVRYAGVLGEFKGISLPLIADKAAKRYSQKRKAGLLFVPILLGDIFYFLLAALGYLALLYGAHNGVFRLHSLLAAALGFILFDFTAGRLILSFSAYILFGLYALWDYICYFLLSPLFRLGKRGARLFLSVGKKCGDGVWHIFLQAVNTVYQPLSRLARKKKIHKLLNGALTYENNQK